jgi:hypothetical protein
MSRRRSGVTQAFGNRRRVSGISVGPPAPAGSVAATAVLSSTGGVVSQSGSGSVAASASLSGTGSSGLVGSGSVAAAAALSGTATVSQAGTGSLAASASLSGSSTVSQAGSGSLAASASLSGTGSVPSGNPAIVQAVYGQSKYNTGTANNPITFASNVTAGNLLVAFGAYYPESAAPTCTDSTSGNTFTVQTYVADADVWGVWIAYCENAVGGNQDELTFGPSGNVSDYLAWGAYEVSGCATSGVVDATATPGDSSSGNTAVGGNLSGLTATNDFIIYMCAFNNAGPTGTSGSPWTLDSGLVNSSTISHWTYAMYTTDYGSETVTGPTFTTGAGGYVVVGVAFKVA